MTRADFIVLLLALLLLPVSYSYFWSSSHVAGSAVQVMKGAKVIEQHSLARDKQIRVPGLLGNSVLEIQNGRIRFIDSPCTGKYCIHTGWIKQVGDFAACLPNQISVHIIGKASRFDAINF